MYSRLSLIIMIIFFIAQVGYGKHADCLAPTICSELQSSFEILQTKLKKKEFKKFLSLLMKASEKSCKIEGVKVLVPAYRVCYDQGYTTKTDAKGQSVLDKKNNGPISEEVVLGWFIFAEESKFPEGKKFTRGKKFQSTLDGYWAERFSDQ